ncbi:MAG: hypothetical protein KME31_07720 [Tolypothrix carrinoi HA7290-LM1]|nr:hypothetical protein [Tolypothrix carrinoi HA7290-LM1]
MIKRGVGRQGDKETRGQGGQGGQGDKANYSFFPITNYQCPMTADAPLGETPRPHCLPNSQCPMPITLVLMC